VLNLRNLFRSELLRNTSLLVSGTIAAQLISILLQPIIRRLYPAEAFGTYSVYMSLIGIIAVISTLRYDDAIVLPAKEKDSANLVVLSQIYNLLVSVALFLIFLLFGKPILKFISLPSGFSVSILFLIPAGVFLINMYQAFNYWLIRKKKYTNVSVNKTIRRGSEGIAQISLALVRNPKGLIFSDIIGQAANVIATLVQSVKNGFSFKLISLSKLKYVSGKYSVFPLYNLIPALMSACSFLLPPVFINKFYSAQNAGYFDTSKFVLAIPLALVATSISNVLLQRIAEKFNAGKSFMGDLKPLFSIVLAICLIEVVAIVLFGPVLFRIVFGREWEISGVISRIMVWSFVLNFIVSSFSCIFYSMRKIKVYSLWQIFYFLGIISLLFFRNMDFFSFLKIYVMIEVTCYLLLSFIMFRLVMSYENSLMKS
jgi:O-antigen/teichoic acid export membrane protein